MLIKNFFYVFSTLIHSEELGGPHCETVNNVFVKVYSFSLLYLKGGVFSPESQERSSYHAAVSKSTSSTLVESLNLPTNGINRNSTYYSQDSYNLPPSHQNHIKYPSLLAPRTVHFIPRSQLILLLHLWLKSTQLLYKSDCKQIIVDAAILFNTYSEPNFN